jgi:import inner membrane translocase subunit TIM23
MKQGSATANTCGSIAVIYSAFGVILSWIRGADDDLNTIVAATATGCLYKSTGN